VYPGRRRTRMDERTGFCSGQATQSPTDGAPTAQWRGATSTTVLLWQSPTMWSRLTLYWAEREEEPEMTKPLAILAGVRILSFTSFLLGPAAVQYLADLGADVVKIEPTTGAFERHWAGGNTFIEGVSAFYMLSHRNVR